MYNDAEKSRLCSVFSLPKIVFVPVGGDAAAAVYFFFFIFVEWMNEIYIYSWAWNWNTRKWCMEWATQAAAKTSSEQ